MRINAIHESSSPRSQKEVYDSGVATIISEKKKTIVALRPATSSYESTQRPEIIVSVFNRSDNEFHISPQNIKVLVDGKPIKVLSYEELVAEVKRKQTIQAVAAALSGVADGINAANDGYTYHRGSTSVYGNNGYSGYALTPEQPTTLLRQIENELPQMHVLKQTLQQFDKMRHVL